jgi:hypothetical protein
VGDNNNITIGNGTIQTTVTTTTNANFSNGSKYNGTGPNTVELGRNNTLTIMPNATVAAMGTNQQSEAINVMGFGNIIINRGTIFNNISAAIFLQNNSGPVIYGSTSGQTTTPSSPQPRGVPLLPTPPKLLLTVAHHR